jgi:hypothetical protein
VYPGSGYRCIRIDSGDLAADLRNSFAAKANLIFDRCFALKV